MRQIFALFFCLLLIGCGHSAKVRAEAQDARARVLSLIVVNSSLAEAEEKLKAAGFHFGYSKAIDQTGRGDELVQLVCVHPIYTRPTAMDTFRYTVGLPEPKSRISPYVVIYADMTGKSHV